MGSPEAHNQDSRLKSTNWEKVLAYVVGMILLGVGCYLMLRNEPFRDPNFVVILRIMISLAAATIGATIPGFFHISSTNKRWTIRAGGALALFVLTYLFTPKVLPPPPPEMPKTTSLVLRMEDESGPTVATANTNAGYVFQFSVANPTSGLAIIDDMACEVLDVIEDHVVVHGAVVKTYKYEVNVNSKTRGPVSFAKGFKYSPGEIDRFAVNVVAEHGYDYFVRMVVTWFDAAEKTKKATYSEVYAIRLPLAPAKQEVAAATREAQDARVEKRLLQLQSSNPATTSSR